MQFFCSNLTPQIKTYSFQLLTHLHIHGFLTIFAEKYPLPYNS